MPNDSTLSIIVKLQDEASAKLAAISDNVSAMGSKISSSVASVGSQFESMGAKMTSAGQSMQNAGLRMSVGLTAPIVALGTAVFETSTKFEASMELIRTQAGATQQEVDSMTKSVLALARSGETGQGPQALADGLYHLESLGLRGAAAMDALKTSAQAADLGMADMEGVTNALGAAIVTGIKGTQDMNQAMGLLDATIGQGNMRMDDLVAALGTGILPAAKNFGLTLQDVGAALATLTDNGMRADESATRLRMTFSLIAAPTQKAQDAFASIGLSAYQLADDMRGPNGLVTAVDDLKKHLEDSGKSATEQAAILSEAFGGGRTSAAILTLVEQSDRLKNKFDQIGASADTFAEKVAATHETNQFKLNAAMAQMQSILIDLGGTVMPMVVRVLQVLAGWMQTLTEWFDKLSPSVQRWIVIGLALLAVLGPILVVVGSITMAIGSLATGIGAFITFMATAGPALWGVFVAGGPILWAIVAVVVVLGLAAYEVYKHWSTIKPLLIGLWNDIKAAWQDISDFLEAIWSGLINWFADNFVTPILNSIQAIINAFNRMVSIVSTPVRIVSNVLSSVTSAVSSTLPHFEQGGIVPGAPGQAVPIVAHAGEEVIPANQVGTRGGSVTINIVNPSVRSNSDVLAIRNEIDRYMRPLMRNAKIIHV